jgi:2-keto-3-deoxy-L-rhamnonate aldolase RhmA
VLARLREKRPVRLCSMGHFFPAFVRHAAHFGYDAIWLDLEHRAMDAREVQSLLAFFHLFDIDCMLRPPTVEKTGLYRYLEDGAAGLMIPHVSTAEKAQMLVQSIKFPPIGDRGIDAAGLDSDFQLAGGPEYTGQANRETFLAVQIETPQAVQNVGEIAAVEGIDVLFLGPADLGLRLRHSATPGMSLDDARRRVADAAQRHGKAWGQPAGSPEQYRKLLDEGATFIAYGSEFLAMTEMLQRCAAQVREILGE